MTAEADAVVALAASFVLEEELVPTAPLEVTGEVALLPVLDIIDLGVSVFSIASSRICSNRCHSISLCGKFLPLWRCFMERRLVSSPSIAAACMIVKAAVSNEARIASDLSRRSLAREVSTVNLSDGTKREEATDLRLEKSCHRMSRFLQGEGADAIAVI